MRLWIGKKVGPVWIGVSGRFHPSRIFHGGGRVPSPLAWFIIALALAALYLMLKAAQ